MEIWLVDRFTIEPPNPHMNHWHSFKGLPEGYGHFDPYTVDLCVDFSQYDPFHCVVDCNDTSKTLHIYKTSMNERSTLRRTYDATMLVK